MPMRRSPNPPFLRTVVAGGVLILSATVMSCSWVADTINPMALFDGGEQSEPIPGEDEDFPTLRDVPDSPRPASSPEDLERMVEGLVADKTRARHTEQTLRSRYADEAEPGEPTLHEPVAPGEAEPTSRVTPGAGDLEIDAGRPSAYAVASATERVEILETEALEPVSATIEPAVEKAERKAPERSTPTADARRQVTEAFEDIEPASAAVLSVRADEEPVRTRRVRPVVEEGSTDALAGADFEPLRASASEIEQAEDVPQDLYNTGEARLPEVATAADVPLEELTPGAGPERRAKRSETETMEDLKALILRRMEESGQGAAVVDPVDMVQPALEPTLASAAQAVPAVQLENQITRFDAAAAFQAETDALEERRSARRSESGDPTTFDLAALDPGAPTGGSAVSFLAATIPFSDGSVGLSEADRSTIRKVANLYGELGGTVRVVGHASHRTPNMNVGEHKFINFQISLDRANAVGTALARAGIPTEALRIDARSDNEPVAYEFMPAGEAENRRAEIFIEY